MASCISMCGSRQCNLFQCGSPRLSQLCKSTAASNCSGCWSSTPPPPPLQCTLNGMNCCIPTPAYQPSCGDQNYSNCNDVPTWDIGPMPSKTNWFDSSGHRFQPPCCQPLCCEKPTAGAKDCFCSFSESECNSEASSNNSDQHCGAGGHSGKQWPISNASKDKASVIKNLKIEADFAMTKNIQHDDGSFGV